MPTTAPTRAAIYIAAPVQHRQKTALEVWPESHWPSFALREADVLKSILE